MVKTALAAICAFTLFATAYLTASLLILQPPRSKSLLWAVVASVIVVQGALTLVALKSTDAGNLRNVVAAGGVVIASVGALSIYRTVTGSHFEGYALVLGSALLVQGWLTVLPFRPLPPLPPPNR